MAETCSWFIRIVMPVFPVGYLSGLNVCVLELWTCFQVVKCVLCCLQVQGHSQCKNWTQERWDGVLRGRVGHGRFSTSTSAQCLRKCNTSPVFAPTLGKLRWKWNFFNTAWQSGKHLSCTLFCSIKSRGLFCCNGVNLVKFCWCQTGWQNLCGRTDFGSEQHTSMNPVLSP